MSRPASLPTRLLVKLFAQVPVGTCTTRAAQLEPMPRASEACNTQPCPLRVVATPQVLGVVATTSSATRRKRESALGACGSARGMRLSGCLWCRVPQGFSGRAARSLPLGSPHAVACASAFRAAARLPLCLRRPRGDWWARACSSAGTAASRAVRRPIDGPHRRRRPEREGQGRTSAALRRANATALGGSGRCSEYYGGRVLARIGH